eukprot:1314757-Amorphochlora_amoeboformis.AAC.1
MSKLVFARTLHATAEHPVLSSEKPRNRSNNTVKTTVHGPRVKEILPSSWIQKRPQTPSIMAVPKIFAISSVVLGCLAAPETELVREMPLFGKLPFKVPFLERKAGNSRVHVYSGYVTVPGPGIAGIMCFFEELVHANTYGDKGGDMRLARFTDDEVSRKQRGCTSIYIYMY